MDDWPPPCMVFAKKICTVLFTDTNLGSTTEKHLLFHQPAPIEPLRLECDWRPFTASSQRPRWAIESRSLLSRTSSRVTAATRKSKAHRPKIGTPSNFRKVDERVERPKRIYQPLELSILIPGNELQPLPIFSKDAFTDQWILEYPSPAFLRSSTRSNTILSRSSTVFTVPRKPVPSTRRTSLAESHYSDCSNSFSIAHSRRSRSYSIVRDQGTTIPQSTQDFLDLLGDTATGPPVPPKHKPFSKSPKTIHRSASDQNLRLRTHLEEREEIEMRLQDCDTIFEEWQYEPEQDCEIAARRSTDFTSISSGRQRISSMRHGKWSPSPSQPPFMRCSLPPVPQLPPSLQNSPSLSGRSTPLGSPPTQSASFPAQNNPPPPIPRRLRPSLYINWIHPEQNQTTQSDQLKHARQRSAPLALVHPSLASPWSTPPSSPRRKTGVPLRCRMEVPCRDLVSDVQNRSLTGVYGVAF